MQAIAKRRLGSAATSVSTHFPLGRIASACALLVLFSGQAGAQQAQQPNSDSTVESTQPTTPAQPLLQQQRKLPLRAVSCFRSHEP